MSRSERVPHRIGYVVAAASLAALAVATTRGAGAASSKGGPGAAPRVQGRVLLPQAVGCATDAALCFDDGRFLVEVSWKNADGATQTAHAFALTPDTGYFWFTDPDNVEVAVKILNGCGVNGRSWFFAGGMTNVETIITVTDTATNEVKTYSSPAGIAFQPVSDTTAFGCPGAATLSIGNPEEPRLGVLPDVNAKAKPLRRAGAEIGCTGSNTVLCIDGRFRVEATWESASGTTGDAHAVTLSSESGYFWFFDPTNIEMFVKTLNACGLERGNWFFGAGLTAVGVHLTVTDTFNNEVRTYTNPTGTPFQPIQDTTAFSFCPTPTNTPTPTTTPTPTATALPTGTGTPRPTHTPWTNPMATVTPLGPPAPVIRSAVSGGGTLTVSGSDLGGCASTWTTWSFYSGGGWGEHFSTQGCDMVRTATCQSGNDTQVILGPPLASTCSRMVRVQKTDGTSAQHNY
jgi:hypothetical protein